MTALSNPALHPLVVALVRAGYTPEAIEAIAYAASGGVVDAWWVDAGDAEWVGELVAEMGVQA